MKANLLTLVLLTLVISAGIASAASFTATIDAGFTKTDNIAVLTITDTSGVANSVTVEPISAITDGENSLSVSGAGVVSVPANGTGTVNLTYSGDTTNFALGTFSTDVKLTSGSDNKTLKLNFVSSFCKYGVVGEVYDLDIDVELDNRGYGEEDEEWYPLDNIEIDVDLENNGDEDISDINLEVCLYNPGKDKCILDEDDMDLDDNDFKIKDGDDKTVKINFQLDPDAVDENVDDYVLYIKAYSKDSDLGEDELCTEYSQDIKVIRDSHFVVLNDIELPEKVSCGSDVKFNAEVWNIGDDDEEDVYVIAYNPELGINSRVDIGDIDMLEKEDIEFTIQIPEDAEAKRYPIEFRVYDEDDDIYENDNDEEAKFVYYTEVECAEVKEAVKGAEITAVLQTEDVKAGKEIVIKAAVKNTGEEETAYTIGVDGNELFSTVASIEPTTLTLKPGESGNSLITLNLNKDVVGEQLFNIKVVFNGKEVKQAVSFTVTPGFTITGSAIAESVKENWFIWAIVVVNIILIIAIISVAVRMSRV